MREGDDDLALARRALGGDDRAFTALMRRHKDGLYRFVRRYVGDADAAYDVTQEAFVAAWRALDRFDARRPFPTWLRAIAMNKCRDRARRLAVRRVVLGERPADGPEAMRTPDPAPSPEMVADDLELRRALDQAIARLPAKLKEPLLLTYFDDMSQQEAADVLGVSVKTVETRAYRARQQLAEILRPKMR